MARPLTFAAWRLAAFALMGASLCGCGFTPLYATPNLSPGLAAIDVVAPQGRVGYLLREDLDDALGHDKSAAPAWRLDVTVDQTRAPRGLTLTDVAERYILGVSVKYALTEVATGKVVHSGQVASHVSYDQASDPYAGCPMFGGKQVASKGWCNAYNKKA